MGLAAPKDRTKLARDPRNTFWTNDTSRFGHRYLSQLGWAPGSTLGDTSSAYHRSGHVTEASSTGVRIALKDDTLGIGAKRGAQEDECFGLLGLQGLLGRLNGDEKAVEGVRIETQRRTEERLHSRYGIRFVRGETWRSSEIEELRERMVGEKRKREEEEEGSKELKRRKSKSKSKKEKRGKLAEASTSVAQSDDDDEADAKPKLSKKEKSTKKRTSEDSSTPEETTEKSKKKKKSKRSPKPDSSDEGEDTKSKSKKKRDHSKKSKDKRSKKKKEKRKRESSSSSDNEESTTTVEKVAAVLTGRQALRSRYIAAKRGAMLDAKALNEILMIKA